MTLPALLTLNAGSSSLKYAVFARDGDSGGSALARGNIGGLGADGSVTDHASALSSLLARLPDEVPGYDIVAVGHRVVHGGTTYADSIAVTPAVLDQIEALVPLAPLHQPHNVAGIRAAMQHLPGTPQIACFDTAFHRSNPAPAQRLALPRHWHDAGVRRYGFHGLSYEYIASRLRALAPTEATGRVIVAHLGAGASLCALRGGRSIATSMGFSTLDGLVMATRCGTLDAGAVLHLLRHHGLSLDAVESLLYRESGLLGVSGISGDMRDLLATNAPEASEAVELFCYRAVREIGALMAELGGIDLLVFTGGIGTHAAIIRQRIADGLAWVGLVLDDSKNLQAGGADMPDSAIHDRTSRVHSWVLTTDEESVIARHVRRIISASP